MSIELFRQTVKSRQPYVSDEYRVEGRRGGAAFWRYSLTPISGPDEEVVTTMRP